MISSYPGLIAVLICLALLAVGLKKWLHDPSKCCPSCDDKGTRIILPNHAFQYGCGTDAVTLYCDLPYYRCMNPYCSNAWDTWCNHEAENVRTAAIIAYQRSLYPARFKEK